MIPLSSALLLSKNLFSVSSLFDSITHTLHCIMGVVVLQQNPMHQKMQFPHCLMIACSIPGTCHLLNHGGLDLTSTWTNAFYNMPCGFSVLGHQIAGKSHWRQGEQDSAQFSSSILNHCFHWCFIAGFIHTATRLGVYKTTAGKWNVGPMVELTFTSHHWFNYLNWKPLCYSGLNHSLGNCCLPWNPTQFN